MPDPLPPTLSRGGPTCPTCSQTAASPVPSPASPPALPFTIPLPPSANLPDPDPSVLSPQSSVLRLRAARRGPRTVLTEVLRTAPFHPSPPSYRAGAATAEVTVQQAGPGLLPGDALRAEVAVGPGAALVVRGQGATKLYPSPTGVPALSLTHLRVAPGATLLWLPGELIPFRAAVLQQETTVDLAPGARLALAEILTPGRLHRGERDAYTRLDLRLRIALAGRPILIERARLDPARRPLATPGRHGPFPCAATLYLFGFGDFSLPHSNRDAPVLAGADRTPDGLLVVRLLGPTPQALRARIDALLHRAHGAG